MGGILFPLFPLLLYFWGNFYDLTEPYSLSMFFGIVSYCYFHEALIISSRIKLLDRLCGHDRVMIFHRHLASVAFITAIIHRQIKVVLFPYTSGQILLGTIALVLIVVITLVTFLFMVPRRLVWKYFSRWFKLDYSFLKGVHNVFVVAVILLSFHVFFASATWELTGRMIFMAGLPIISLGFWLNHRIFRPLRNRKRQLVVTENRKLNGSINEVRFSGNIPNYKAGQFAFFRFIGQGVTREEHPFTLSSAPSEEWGGITIKSLGNFTAKIDSLVPGTAVILDGPYGRFSIDPVSKEPLVFIAGGIGITPFFSILKSDDLSPDRPVFLFWAAKGEEDLIYKDEISALAKEKNITFIPMIRNGQSPSFLSAEFMREHLKEPASSCSFYFCGPSPMFRSLEGEWKKLGLSKGKIHYEKFSL
jgi:predicted ferric reductase